MPNNWGATSYPQNYRAVFTTRAGGNSVNNLVIGMSASDRKMYIYSGSFIIPQSSQSSGFDAITWRHFCLTRDHTLSSNNTKFYIDGVLKYQLQNTHNFSDNKFNIGGDAVDSHRFYGKND